MHQRRTGRVRRGDGWPAGRFRRGRLNAFHQGMGAIDIIGVDPDYQRRGISSRLTEFGQSTCAAVAWTSPWWRPAATPDICAGGVRGSGVHAPADCQILPTARLKASAVRLSKFENPRAPERPLPRCSSGYAAIAAMLPTMLTDDRRRAAGRSREPPTSSAFPSAPTRRSRSERQCLGDIRRHSCRRAG